MGLADLLIYCENGYGSPEGNKLVDKVFETIATTAYGHQSNWRRKKEASRSSLEKQKKKQIACAKPSSIPVI